MGLANFNVCLSAIPISVKKANISSATSFRYVKSPLVSKKGSIAFAIKFPVCQSMPRQIQNVQHSTICCMSPEMGWGLSSNRFDANCEQTLRFVSFHRFVSQENTFFTSNFFLKTSPFCTNDHSFLMNIQKYRLSKLKK